MEKTKRSVIESAFLGVYTFVLFLLNFIRIFDNNLWGDEAFTAKLSRMSLKEMLIATAEDVHPPLYYVFVMIGRQVLGEHGWMYHLVSLIPYAIILILAVAVVRKAFGTGTGFVFVSFASLLPMAVNYNVEIRMYSWGELFVLGSFLALYGIIKEKKSKHFAWFVISSLAAAYTHYYCLISVAFLYVFLIGYTVIKQRRLMRKTVLSCVVTVVVYLPWLIVLIKTFMRTSASYWITEIPSFWECCKYLFSGNFEIVFLAELLLFLVLFIIMNHKQGMDELLWIMAGIAAVLGTIVVGISVSKLVRPVFLVRYLFPVSAVAWLILAVVVTQRKWKKLWTGITVALILVGCVPQYYTTYVYEERLSQALDATIEEIDGQIKAGDTIFTTNEHMEWATAEYYFPGVQTVFCEGDLSQTIQGSGNLWLIVNDPPSDAIVSWVHDQGYEFKALTKAGQLGLQTVYIYQLISVY